MSQPQNPFSDNPVHAGLWDMAVARDIAAFVEGNWDMIADDFIEAGFTGLHAHKSPNPDDWTLAFPALADYRDEWLRQAKEAAGKAYAEPLGAGIHRATTLDRIEITGDAALLHKKFDGVIRLADGSEDRLNWQTLYYCRHAGGRWRISGFVGYMPYR